MGDGQRPGLLSGDPPALRLRSPRGLVIGTTPRSFGLRCCNRDSISVYKHLKEGGKRMRPGSSQWCPVTGPEATGTH